MIKKLLAGLSVLIAIICIAIYFFLQSGMPSYGGEKKIVGLKSEVEIIFDHYAIPHIYAKNAEDAYTALGYVHAQERLFQMEMVRRLASGRMSEILGKDLLDVDVFFRTMGIRKSAEKSAERLNKMTDSPVRKHALAYLAGVNQFVNNGSTPLEFKLLGIPKAHFTLTDIYTVIGYTTFGFSNAAPATPAITRMYQKYGNDYMKDWNVDPVNTVQDTVDLSQTVAIQAIFDKVKEYAMFPIKMGSNAWVVAPKKSKSGKVILANDTHIFFAQPSTWFEAHIEYPGFSFYGNYLAGVPFGFVGHNPAVAWGLTIFPVDNMDLYAEKQNPQNPNELWVNDHWQVVNIYHEQIKIKDQPDTTITIRMSRHGPMINHLLKGKDKKQPLSVRWVYNEMPTTVLEAAYELNHATNIDEARHAASLVDVLGLNVMYGDSSGNIAWWASGKISKRPPYVNSKVILDGASGKDELIGYYDFNLNPQIENPKAGYLYSANHRPNAVNGINYQGHYTPLSRAIRIKNYLVAKDKLGVNDFKTMQQDVISDTDKEAAHYFAKKLDNLLQKDTLGGIELLANWDGDYQKEDIIPLIYTKIQYYMIENGLKDELGEDDFNAILNSYLVKRTILTLFKNDTSLWWDNINTPEKETFDDILVTSYRQSMTDLKTQLGEDKANWKWGDVHTLTHVHPIGKKKPFDKLFNVGPFPMPGSNAVLNKQAFKLNAIGKYEVFIGPALRIIHDFNQPNNSLGINPTGQSGHVMSAHYDDQALMYNQGLYRKQMTDSLEIEENKMGTLLLTPTYE